jgi:hypothetical protein
MTLAMLAKSASSVPPIAHMRMKHFFGARGLNPSNRRIVSFQFEKRA